MSQSGKRHNRGVSSPDLYSQHGAAAPRPRGEIPPRGAAGYRPSSAAARSPSLRGARTTAPRRPGSGRPGAACANTRWQSRAAAECSRISGIVRRSRVINKSPSLRTFCRFSPRAASNRSERRPRSEETQPHIPRGHVLCKLGADRQARPDDEHLQGNHGSATCARLDGRLILEAWRGRRK